MFVHNKDIVKNFCEYTTIHGIGRISSSKLIAAKIIWMCIVLLAFSMCIRQIYLLSYQYASNQINTKVSIKYKEVEFPAVTFCNLNPVSYQRLIELSETYELLGHFKSLIDYSPVDSTDNNREKEEWHSSMNEILYYYNISFALKAGLDEFLVKCEYHNTVCDERNFTSFNDNYYGKCYKFAPGQRISNHAGQLFSLKMLLNVNQSDYLPNVIDEVGIRISLHEHGVKPYLLNNGISISAGFRTNIALRQKLIQRLPSYDCDYSGKYGNILACLEDCVRLSVIKYCNCTDDIAEYNEDKMIFSCFRDEELACMLQQQRNPEKCNCLNPCSERQYLKDITMTKWPSTKYENVVEDMLRKRNLNYSNLRDNLVYVNIFFSSLTEEVTEEELAYTIENFVSDIGGSLGLWIGMSIISLGEIIELFILLLSRKRHRIKNDFDDKVGNQNNDTVLDLNDDKL